MLAILLSFVLMTCSWYGPGFDGNVTANGETYDQDDLTAAHRSLPFDTLLLLEYKDNEVTVRINDRGPYSFEALEEGKLEPHPERELDLSKAAFSELADPDVGIIDVDVTILRRGSDPPPLFIPPQEVVSHDKYR